MCDDNSDEPTVPRAALNKMLKDCAPNFRFANETRDLIHACCLDFIKLVSDRANKICVQECRKTISHEHTLKALKSLGFGPAYDEAASSVLGECKEAAQKRLKRLNSRLEKCGVPVEELEKQQAELFEKARVEQAEIEQAQIARLLHERELVENRQELSDTVALNANGAVTVENSLKITVAQVPPANFPSSSFKLELDENYDID